MKQRIVILLVLFVITTPLFFTIYRDLAFNTIPHDPYEEYLLNLVGKSDINIGSPFIYRIGSVSVAVPFYYMIPSYKFTNLNNIDSYKLKAIRALAMISYLSIVLTAFFIYLLSKRDYGANNTTALCFGLISIFLSGFVSRVGVDPIAILFICVLLYVINQPYLFGILVILSAGFNEKIPFVFWVLILARITIFPKRYWIQFISTCIAMALYLSILMLLPFVGNEEQKNLSLLGAHLFNSVHCMFTFKGIWLIWQPCLILIIMIILSIRNKYIFYVSDNGVFIILFLLASVFGTSGYDEGRLCMYSYPFYLPSLTKFLNKISTKGI